MINKRLMLDKAIENANYAYQDALQKKDTATAAKHQTRMSGLISLKQQLETSGELNDYFDYLPHGKKGR